jgi:hypothetical protein
MTFLANDDLLNFVYQHFGRESLACCSPDQRFQSINSINFTVSLVQSKSELIYIAEKMLPAERVVSAVKASFPPVKTGVYRHYVPLGRGR